MTRRYSYAKNLIDFIRFNMSQIKNHKERRNILSVVSQQVPNRSRAPCKSLSLYDKSFAEFATKRKKYENKIKNHREMLIKRKKEVANFFLDDANSSPAPGACEYIIKQKKNAKTLLN